LDEDDWNSESLTAFLDLKKGSFDGLIKLLESERRVSKHIIEFLRLSEEDPSQTGIGLKRIAGARGRPKARPPIFINEEEALERLYDEGFADILEKIGNRLPHITSSAGLFIFKDTLSGEYKIPATDVNAFLAVMLDVSERTVSEYLRLGKKSVQEIEAIADEKRFKHTLTSSGRKSYALRRQERLFIERKPSAGKPRRMFVLRTGKE
jgi:hypothetical protein